MSVNGTGLDRKTKKPLNDQTSWTVKSTDGTVLSVREKGKERQLSGLNASDAFNYAASARRKGIWAVPVRT
jgi:hypothetical protein